MDKAKKEAEYIFYSIVDRTRSRKEGPLSRDRILTISNLVVDHILQYVDTPGYPSQKEMDDFVAHYKAVKNEFSKL
jgi:hypothetical protein